MPFVCFLYQLISNSETNYYSDPITRVSSLYWAEHVGWFDGILRQPEKCSTYRAWVNAWRDNSKWKREFVAANPGNLYVEIENYYVKALTGWQGNTTISKVDLEKAKKVSVISLILKIERTNY